MRETGCGAQLRAVPALSAPHARHGGDRVSRAAVRTSPADESAGIWPDDPCSVWSAGSRSPSAGSASTSRSGPLARHPARPDRDRSPSWCWPSGGGTCWPGASSAALRDALASAAARNRELERLRQLAATLLGGSDLTGLVQEIATAAADLLEAESGGVTLVVEEGRFLRIAAAIGRWRRRMGLARFRWTARSWAGSVTQRRRRSSSNDMDVGPAQLPPAGSGASAPHRGDRPASLRRRRHRHGQRATTAATGAPFGDARPPAARRPWATRSWWVSTAPRCWTRAAGTSATLAAKNVELQRAHPAQERVPRQHEPRAAHPAQRHHRVLRSDALRRQVGPSSSAQHREFLEAVLRNGRHLLDADQQHPRPVQGRGRADDARARPHRPARGDHRRRGRHRQSAAAPSGSSAALDLDDTPLHVVADGVRVRQVLFNLLSNASKFTPEGGEHHPLRAPHPRAAGRCPPSAPGTSPGW